MKIAYKFIVLLVLAPIAGWAQQDYHRSCPHPARADHFRLGPRAAASSHKIATHDDSPPLRYTLVWNGQTSRWDSLLRVTATYSPTGAETERISEHFTGFGYENDYRFTMTYDAQDRMTSWSQAVWSNNAWLNTNRSEYGYDSFGNFGFDIELGWNGTNWDSVTGQRVNYTYVYNNKVAEEVVESWDSAAPSWILDNRSVYHWPDSTNWDTLTGYYWTGNWTPDHRVIILSWLPLPGLMPDSSLFQDYNISTFQNMGSRRAVIGPNGRMDWYDYNWDGMAWTPSLWISQFTDSLGHLVQVDNFNWNSTWVLSSSERSHYQYSPQGRTEEIVYDSWDLNSAAYLQGLREVFPEPVALGALAPHTATLEVQAYPNPCTDRLNLRFWEPISGPWKLALYDLQGRLRMQSQATRLTDQALSIPISESLASGTYTYLLSTKTGIAQGKVVVQH